MKNDAAIPNKGNFFVEFSGNKVGRWKNDSGETLYNSIFIYDFINVKLKIFRSYFLLFCWLLFVMQHSTRGFLLK